MKRPIRFTVFLCAVILCSTTWFFAAEATAYSTPSLDTQVSGTVVSAEDGQPLPGVNVTVKGKIIGTSTDTDGNFSLNISQDPPLTLVFSIVGYRTFELEITTQERNDIRVEMQEQTIMGSDVVVSASRVEESILEAPVTIEKMDIINIRNTPSDDYYKALSNMKGIDMTTSSINFQIVNSRGFNSTGNTRMVQLVDGMDTQAPALNFPIGNLNGPSELDVESMEFIPGAASALYGPNAFNGILLINSKDPFDYQGLSVMVKSGLNHLDGNVSAGEPGNPQPTWNTAIRYAKAFNNRFVFKVNFAYSQAEDWRGVDFSDKNDNLKSTGLPAEARNPAYDGVHLYGDDGSFNIGLLGLSSDFVQGMSQQFGLSAQDAQQYALAIPNQPVNRTGYQESYLVDNGAENLKVNTALHYRISDQVEASYTLNYGYGTSVYTGAQRYSLKNFNITQHKLQLDGSNFQLKAYGTFEDSGDSYIADFVGFAVNNAYTNNTDWFATYGGTVVGALVQQVQQATGSTSYNSQVVSGVLNNPQALASIYNNARSMADANRYAAGTESFEAAKNAALENTIPNGALFDDASRFYHVEGQYNFSDHIDFADVILGASYRQFQLRSNGTIFDDANEDININEWGTYLQASKALLDNQLKLTGSIRYDKNENFDGQFSPRLSGVFTVADNHNIRASFQTGFRNPTTQGQYIDLNVISARLLGGLPRFANQYGVDQSTYTIGSVLEFQDEVLAGNSNAASVLVPYDTYNPVEPEQIQAYEIGYKGLIAEKLFIDAAYYYNVYDNFITQIRVRQINSDLNGNGTIEQAEILDPSPQTLPLLLSGDFRNTFQIYTNFDNTVEAQGAVIGLDYSLPRGYRIGANYNWNQLITDLDEFQNDYNTPEHKVNVQFGNRNLTNHLGFNIAYRWQDSFMWISSFAQQQVDAVSTVDAQISYRLPQYNSTVKLGGSNIFNDQYTLSAGGPQLGAIYYVSLTFDQLFR